MFEKKKYNGELTLNDSPVSMYNRLGLCCATLFLGRHEQTSTHSREENDGRVKKRHRQSPTWWTSEFHWGYLHKCGRVCTCKSTNDSKNAALPKHARAHVTAHESCAFSGVSDDQSLFLDPADLRVFQEAQLIWKCFFTVLVAYISLGKEGTSESVQFQGLPEALELFVSWG